MKTITMHDQWTTYLAVSWLVKRGNTVFLFQGNPALLPAHLKLLVC